MVSKITEAAQDGAFIGYAIKRAGVIIIIVALALALLVSAVANIVIQRNTIKIASELAPKLADRWTGTDMRNYRIQHAREVAIIVAREKREQAAINKELIEAVQAIREILSANQVQLKGIERQLDRIEKKVFNGGDRRP